MPSFTVTPRPMDPAAFAPYGTVTAIRNVAGGRQDFFTPMQNPRATANLNVGLTRAEPKALPLNVPALEKHEHSAQVFLPIIVGRYLATVFPALPDGQPDLANALSFVCDERVAIAYTPQVWHCPFVCIDSPAEMLMLRHDERNKTDTTWWHLPDGTTLTIAAP